MRPQFTARHTARLTARHRLNQLAQEERELLAQYPVLKGSTEATAARTPASRPVRRAPLEGHRKRNGLS